MDTNGKIIWAKHSEIQQANLKAMGDAEIKDGERLPLAVKDMGSCEIYPQTIQHNPNGRYAYTHTRPFDCFSPPRNRQTRAPQMLAFGSQIRWIYNNLFVFVCTRFVVVCGDGEYIIYTAMALRNKSFGSAQEFVWAHDSSE